MGDDFFGLAVLNIRNHGDSREQAAWPNVGNVLSEYETFWRALIVLLTNRIVTNVPHPKEWIRLRPDIPRNYEQLAMHNYSMFYFAAIAHGAIQENSSRLFKGSFPHPEQSFAALQQCTEHAKALRGLAGRILREIGIAHEFPKHPRSLYETIGVYRNAFIHDPVLGRAISHGRELLPRQELLRKDAKPMLWRDAAAIPKEEMIDGAALEARLWHDLSHFLQVFWVSLTHVPMIDSCRTLGSNRSCLSVVPHQLPHRPVRR